MIDAQGRVMLRHTVAPSGHMWLLASDVVAIVRLYASACTCDVDMARLAASADGLAEFIAAKEAR